MRLTADLWQVLSDADRAALDEWMTANGIVGAETSSLWADPGATVVQVGLDAASKPIWLGDYIASVPREDFEKFLGEQSKELAKQIEVAKDVMKRLADR